LATYEAARHFADARAVTKLSAYVHHGQLSARLLAAETVRAGGARLSKTFTRRLIWRDLAYWQLALWPAMARQPMRPHYAAQVCLSGFSRVLVSCVLCLHPSLPCSTLRAVPQP
jgi:deoxyribodipyrimidine photolyase